MDQHLTLALTKGRILQETLPLLSALGISPLDDIAQSRKLVFETTNPSVRLMVLRGSDVPTYVQFGTADIGVSGKDVIMEHGGDGYYEPLDLGIARCRLMTAGVKGQSVRGKQTVRVATKYINVARRYYAEQGRQATFVKLYGAMELAPITGLADEIVDIVDTGNTLRANGLEERELIATISSRIIVNRAAMRLKHDAIQRFLDAISNRLVVHDA
ncbi:MAG: ATP phosphoribosyltransferase [Pseudomonadales bacterium]|nr:ATP phosphoribosyltransferase [Pseudomonadales bacterium]